MYLKSIFPRNTLAPYHTSNFCRLFTLQLFCFGKPLQESINFDFNTLHIRIHCIAPMLNTNYISYYNTIPSSALVALRNLPSGNQIICSHYITLHCNTLHYVPLQYCTVALDNLALR